MKKCILKIFILLLLSLLCVAFAACDQKSDDISDKCVRIHIRANSNSETDQAVKLLVRDEITAYLQCRLQGVSCRQDALSVLDGEKQKLAEIANNVLYQNNFEYKASVTLSNEYFPDRTYDNYSFPEGYYDALVIRLGTGLGDNWWCVAFPPLCFVPSGNSEKVVYKSWIKEMLDKIFS